MKGPSAPIPEEKTSEIGGIIRNLARRPQWNQHGCQAWESGRSELGKDENGAARCLPRSRNAHDQKVLVRRAQWVIKQATLH